MARPIDSVISEQLEYFKEAIEYYLVERDQDLLRAAAQEFGVELLKRVPKWPVPKQWLEGKFGTPERAAFRLLIQAHHRRVKRDKRIEKQKQKVENV